MTKFQDFAQNVRIGTSIALWVCILATVGLFIASFIVPPTGVIDGSVLRAASLLFALASLAVLREAIREGIGAKLTHGNTTIEIKDLDNEEPDGAPAQGRRPEGRFHDKERE